MVNKPLVYGLIFWDGYLRGGWGRLTGRPGIKDCLFLKYIRSSKVRKISSNTNGSIFKLNSNALRSKLGGV